MKEKQKFLLWLFVFSLVSSAFAQISPISLPAQMKGGDYSIGLFDDRVTDSYLNPADFAVEKPTFYIGGSLQREYKDPQRYMYAPFDPFYFYFFHKLFGLNYSFQVDERLPYLQEYYNCVTFRRVRSAKFLVNKNVNEKLRFGLMLGYDSNYGDLRRRSSYDTTHTFNDDLFRYKVLQIGVGSVFNISKTIQAGASIHYYTFTYPEYRLEEYTIFNQTDFSHRESSNIDQKDAYRFSYPTYSLRMRWMPNSRVLTSLVFNYRRNAYHSRESYSYNDVYVSESPDSRYEMLDYQYTLDRLYKQYLYNIGLGFDFQVNQSIAIFGGIRLDYDDRLSKDTEVDTLDAKEFIQIQEIGYDFPFLFGAAIKVTDNTKIILNTHFRYSQGRGILSFPIEDNYDYQEDSGYRSSLSFKNDINIGIIQEIAKRVTWYLYFRTNYKTSMTSNLCFQFRVKI